MPETGTVEWTAVELVWWYDDAADTNCGSWLIEVQPDIEDPLKHLRSTLVTWATNEGRDQVTRNGYCLNWGDLFDLPDEFLAAHGIRLLPKRTVCTYTVNHDEVIFDPDFDYEDTELASR